PPQIYRGNTIKGRWGAWGIDFPAIIFQDKNDKNFEVEIGQNKRLFTLGSDLTRFGSAKKPKAWNFENSNITNQDFEVDLTNWGFELYAITQNKKDSDAFDHLVISHDKKTVLTELSVGEWSEWLPVKLNYKLKNDYQKNSPKKSKFEDELASVEIETFMKIKVIRLGKNGDYRIRILYDNLNEYMTSPSTLASDMRSKVGPMTDYVDNYPPQLIFYPQDKTTFLEEADLSWQWHQRAVPYLIKDLKSDVIIHSIYTPNQMLTSRWWMPFIDKNSYRYDEKNDSEREPLWKDVKAMYQEADKLLGEIMNNTDQNWYVVLSSDHGVVPLYREVRLNNLFHQKGWLNYKFNAETQEYEIDWENTKVIYLQMNNIYINPKNLAGIYNRANSPEYFKLRNEVKMLIEGLEDPEMKKKVTTHIWAYEDAGQAKMPMDRVGDLIIANEAQYNWSEDVSADGKIFAGTKKGGYKQGIWPESAEAMLTPFVIMGPDIKKGCKIDQPIRHVDQFATLSKILGNEAPYKLSGKVIEEIFQK
ncbi:MAG: alkaline phosphatase family protein, partial [Pseudobdellovibrio sp.]